MAPREASFVDAVDRAGVYAREYGLVSERGFFNPGRREGLKMTFLEASEQIEQPIDWYVQAVSSAMGVYGNFKAARELFAMKRIARLPKTLCVQQASCAPMAQAFEEGCEQIEARRMAEEYEGLDVCFSSATAVAGIVKQARAGKLPKGDTVMINLTGADRHDIAAPANMQWLERHGTRWEQVRSA